MFGQALGSRYDHWRLAEQDLPPRRLHAGPDEDEDFDDDDDCEDMDLDDEDDMDEDE